MIISGVQIYIHVCPSFQHPIPSYPVTLSSKTTAEQGKAKLRVLDFKTTLSEFQKPSQTISKQGIAKLSTLDSKTKWSEFQKPSETITKQGVAELRILDFKNHMVSVSEAQ